MKGSPIIATILVILILLGIYAGTRTLLLDGNDQAATADPHAGHDHSSEAAADPEHDDTSLETQFEITFSSKPKSIKITQPATEKEIINTSEIDDVEFTTTTQMSLEGHHVELAVEIVWENPGPMNFAEITVSPARHGTKSATLKSDADIDDIAEFHW